MGKISNYKFQRVPYSLLSLKNTSATENASEDDTNVLPELIASLFNPCSINYLEAELKESSYKSLTDCFYENSQIIFDHLTQVSH